MKTPLQKEQKSLKKQTLPGYVLNFKMNFIKNLKLKILQVLLKKNKVLTVRVKYLEKILDKNEITY